jgi:hypothetical protein
MRNERSGATAGAQGEGSGRDSLDALLRLERALESAGAMTEWAARDIAALRLTLGQRGGDAPSLRAGLLRMTANALYQRVAGGESAPDLRFLCVDTRDLLAETQCAPLLDAEDQRRIEAAVTKRISGEADRY